MTMESLGLNFILPELILALSALALLVIGVYRGNNSAYSQTNVATIMFVIALIVQISGMNVSADVVNGLLSVSLFTNAIKCLILFAGIIVLIASSPFYRVSSENMVPEFPVLVILSVLGMMLMVSSNHLISLYVSLELQSLSFYLLAAINRSSLKSSEAGLKYFILGALASGLLLFGCSFIYGFTGTADFNEIRALYDSGQSVSFGVLLGLVLLIIGLCFKLSVAPFHMWTPDVYEGSPTIVTMLFATLPKVAGMAIFIRILYHPFGGALDQWQQIIVLVAIASMLVGAFGALRQSNIKRLLAYSSIGHVGYMLVGLASGSKDGVAAIMVYITIYVILSLGMFAFILMLRDKEGAREDLGIFSGLAKTKPISALMVAIFMLSMAGIPPFAGFYGKFYIFMAAVDQQLYMLAVIGILSSVVAAFYYLRIIKMMYFDSIQNETSVGFPTSIKVIMVGSTLFNGLFFVKFPVLVDQANMITQSLF